MIKNVAFFWSGGKDSALALFYLLSNPEINVAFLVTTLTKPDNRVTMHGVPAYLIKRQSEAIGIPLIEMELNSKENSTYEKAFLELLENLKELEIDSVGFGDIYLEDLKKYRDGLLEKSGVSGVYPLWKKSPEDLASEFINKGFRSVICAINGNLLAESMAGKEYNQEFIDELPPNVDICGENGEFHSFAFDGPIFKSPVEFKKGKTLFKEYSLNQKGDKLGFYFAELI